MKVVAMICLLVLGVTIRAQLIEETQDLMGAYLLSTPMMGGRGFGGMNPFMLGSMMPAIPAMPPMPAMPAMPPMPPMGFGNMMMPFNYMYVKRR